MSRPRNLIPLFILCVTLCLASDAKSVSTQDEHEEFWKIVRTVQDILEGKNTEQARTSIGQGARLIFGGRFEDLRDVVTGTITTCPLADTSYHGVMIQGRTNQSEDTGFIVLKTQRSDTTKVRFHSVIFMKDSAGQYKIHVWHAGVGGQ